MSLEADLPNSLSSDQLRELARHGARVRLEELRTEIAAIEALLGQGSRERRGRRSARKSSGRRKLSPEGRANIIAAQKARWAKTKTGSSAANAADAPGQRGKAAGRRAGRADVKRKSKGTAKK